MQFVIQQNSVFSKLNLVAAKNLAKAISEQVKHCANRQDDEESGQSGQRIIIEPDIVNFLQIRIKLMHLLSQHQPLEVFQTMFQRLTSCFSFYFQSKYLPHLLLTFQEKVLYHFEQQAFRPDQSDSESADPS